MKDSTTQTGEAKASIILVVNLELFLACSSQVAYQIGA